MANTWPDGVQLVTARWGKGFGTLAEGIEATLKLETQFGDGNDYLVWAATGDPWLPFTEEGRALAGSVGEVQIPVVNQVGWVDPHGNPIQNWRYRSTITYNKGSNAVTITRTFYPMAGDPIIDLDVIPDGAESGPTVVIVQPVRTVNGQHPDTAGDIDLVFTPADAGLSNVDNTADRDKPVSTQQSAAIAKKYTKPSLGIPTTDLTFDLQTTLATAATAVQPAALATKADLVAGVIPTSQIPALAITTTKPVASQAAMLALTSADVQPGDVAVRTDGAGSFILSATDPSILGNWTLLSGPAAAVSSVNGQTGAVVLGKADLGLGNVANTTDAAKPISTATATALAAKADLVGGLIPTSQIPAIALTTAKPVATQAEMLALTTAQAQPGDVAVRSDGAGSFMLVANDPSTLANWVLLNMPAGGVSSINGQTGTVVLSAANVNAEAAFTVLALAKAPANTTFIMRKANGVWPPRTSTRTDLIGIWIGPDPSPAIVAAGGTGGMYEGDVRWITAA